ncbi:ethanolamine ammonia-lyase subunit EutB [Fimbriimonas ginsengisoli]|uniref:Ethanolamine ammonia-lyase large subunit n=1 Tax=Fimbriimonas ginsengisoli Gsoil 348 TaxID=661478 RepID=A0A068NUG1_FIMGI|nr:ethanolamine ammonia-lyase subunit EutB [Fimbriimonas ginsengisoli]AIE87163.1 ethanolamine ammonia lyase large subunit [Fimbriimonas ginsengisoli Gsoil 348]
MPYRAAIGSTSFRFDSLRELLAKATPRRSGDELAGIAAASEAERAAAQIALADVPLQAFLDEPLVEDDVTDLIHRTHSDQSFAGIRSQTVGEFRENVLAKDIGVIRSGVTPEMAAAVSKLMRNGELILAAQRLPVVSRFRTTVGLPGRFSTRLQPNHPTDDPRGVLASTLTGLYFGCGDAVIGINPAGDSVESTITLLKLLDDVRSRLEIPTQSCVLSHVTTQLRAMEAGAPVDLIFQSIGGTEATNKGFGITLSMLSEAKEASQGLNRGTVGNQTMYFETGQGSALSANAHHGIDQQTVECRAYGVARAFDPFLVNTVVGFIGPEYLYDGKQILRAGLEDHFCGKLLGLPMGVDVCYTNHAEADPDDMDSLLMLLALSGVNYVMAVPGSDDVMLGYQSTSYHDALMVRRLSKRRPAPEFEAWLQRQGLLDELGEPTGIDNLRLAIGEWASALPRG